MLRRLSSLLAVTLALAGCSATTAEPLDRATERSPVASVEPGPARSVAKAKDPWAPGRRELGVAVYWQNSATDSDQVLRAKAEKILDHVVALNANAVSVAFPFVMDSAVANAVRFDDPITPSPARTAIVYEEANRRGLRVTVRPMLHEKNLNKTDKEMWRGSIVPTSPAAWLTSYRDQLLPYAKAAQEAKVATFVVGTELNSMERATGWPLVADGLRKVYTGELGYSANHDRLTGPAPAGLLKSVDAYPPLKLPDTATPAQLLAGWNEWLDARSKGPMPDLVLAEIAISARTGAYRKPWSPFGNGPFKPEIQQRWFTTVCQVMKQRDLAGVYFWMINLDSDPTVAPPADSPMDFVGRPGEKDIAACFAQGASRAG